MKVYVTHSHDPYCNLALEEYVLRHWTEDILLLWRNSSSVIIGKNQNTAAEINAAFIEEHNIPVVRRISGGGAVYHDLNNINFSFIINSSNNECLSMHQFMLPLVHALRSMGVPAELDGRNDLAVNGAKISGNAQAIYRNRVLHHGTLLFAVNLDRLAETLQSRPEKFRSRAARSTRARVGNISEWLPGWTVTDFVTRLHGALATTHKTQSLVLTDEEEKEVQRLCREKYQSWGWNFGETPVFDVCSTGAFPGGLLEIHLNVRQGRIAQCLFRGDFLSRRDTAPLANALCGLPYDRKMVKHALSAFSLTDYMGTVTLNDILQCMFESPAPWPALHGAKS